MLNYCIWGSDGNSIQLLIGFLVFPLIFSIMDGYSIALR